MKKSLLIALAVSLAVTVTAQQKSLVNTGQKEKMPSKKSEVLGNEVYGSQEHGFNSVIPRALLNNRRVASGADHTYANSAKIDTLGNANSYRSQSVANNNTIWYDQDVNSVSFVHRILSSLAATTSPNFSTIRYDISKDGGNTWKKNLSAYAKDTIHYITYPTGVIANPSSSTIADSTFISYAGYMYDFNYNGGYLRNDGYGLVQLDTLYSVSHADTLPRYINYSEDVFTVKYGGDMWRLGIMFDTTGHNYNYRDSIIVSHGVWNPVTRDYDYTQQHIRVANDTATFGGVIDMNIAFDDFGQIGYIAMINATTGNHEAYPDSTIYLSVLKTIDGGVTWSYANANSCSGRPDILNTAHCFDAVIGNFHDTTVTYTPGTQMDIVVDKNGDLHIVSAIFFTQGGYTYNSGDSLWGLFDIHSVNGGQTWRGRKLVQPVVLKGVFGDGTTNPLSSQFNRAFASRSWDGSKLFFSWFDTDTVLFNVPTFGPSLGFGNLFPDLWSIAYDVDSNKWSVPKNLTKLTDADAACTFGSGAYYAIDSAGLGTTFSIPTVYMQLDATTATASPVTFFYIKDANMHMSDVTIADNSILVPCAPDYVSQTMKPKGFTVSANYPNPFNGKTSFDISLANASDVSVEVSNLLGSVISMSKYSNLTSGFHTLTIDGNKLSSGVYFYTVKAGNDVVTKKMVIQ